MYAPRAVAAMLERVRGAACAMQRSRGWQRVRCSGPDVQRSRGSTPWGWIIRGSSGENACGACVCVGRAEGPLANDLDDDNTKAKGGGEARLHMPGSRASRASSHLELVPAACPDRRTGGHRRKLSPAARRHRHRRVPRGNLTVQCSTHGGTGCPLALAAQVVRDSLTPLTLSWCTTLLSSS